MKKNFILAMLSMIVFLSCQKSKTSKLVIDSSLIPLSTGNWWKYKFYARIDNSTYSTTSVDVTTTIGDKKTLSNGKEAVLMITTFPTTADTMYVTKENTDLIFYNTNMIERCRLVEPVLVNKGWKSLDDSVKVISMENLNVPAGNFTGTFFIHQKYNDIPCCFFKALNDNYYWIRPGAGIIKQDIYFSFAGPTYTTFFTFGRYELASSQIN